MTKKTQKSAAELFAISAIKEFDKKIDAQTIFVADAKHLRDISVKLLMKLEEIVKSRDNWRNKYKVSKKLGKVASQPLKTSQRGIVE